MVMKSNVGTSSQYAGEIHASSDIEAGTQSNLCADSIRKKLSQRPNPSLWPTSCIYRVPQRIRQVMEDAYTPETVPIGPYHHVAPMVKATADLKAMENHKLEYVQAVLDRTTKTICLDDYVNALIKLEAEARGCYSEPLNDFSSEQFVEMMLIDGLFIIELFRKHSDGDFNDPIFSSVMGASVVRDLVMLENQLPMSVLQKLFDLSKPGSRTLIEMALSYFDWLIPGAISDKYPGDKNNRDTHKNLVDLLSYTICSSLPIASESSVSSTLPKKEEEEEDEEEDEEESSVSSTLPKKEEEEEDEEESSVSSTLPKKEEEEEDEEDEEESSVSSTLPCVMELQRSGIKFKMGSTSGSLMDIKFNKGNGVFEIPPVYIHDLTDSFFRNLIAYEQCRFQGTFYITSYAILMFYLINSADDVAILRKRGIIINQLGDDNKVSSLFINLPTGSSNIEFSYGKLCKDVNDYYKKPYHKWKAAFKRNYCNSPWSIVSVVVAPIIFFVTIWATVFTTLPVFKVNA